MNIGRLAQSICLLLSWTTVSCSSSPNSNPGPTTLAWTRECVGEFTLELPGQANLPIPRWADVLGGHARTYAFVSPSAYNRDNLFTGTRDQKYQPQAWGSKQTINGAEVFPGPALTLEEFGTLKLGIDKAQQDIKAELSSENLGNIAERIQLAPSASPDSFMWGKGAYKDVFLWRNGHTFLYRPGADTDQDLNAEVQYALTNLEAREVFEIPSTRGLCLQNGFLPESSKTYHSIGVTYRIQDHPEIEIFLEDNTVARPSKSDGTYRSPAEEVRLFWDGRYGGSNKEHKIIHPHIPGVIQFPDVTIGGYKGKSSFVQITRKDNSIDYGYMAYAMDPSSGKPNAPSLLLYVVRDARRAKGEPLSKAQVQEIAEHIAASIHRRAATQ